MLLHGALQFEFVLFLINLFIKKNKDNEWVKEKESVTDEFVLFERDKLLLKLEVKLTFQLFEKSFRLFPFNSVYLLN